MAAQVRVVLGMLPPLLGGIVRRLLAVEPGVTVVGEAHDPAALVAAARRHRPHAVVLEMDGDTLPPPVCSLICDVPGLALVGIAPDHSRATLFVLRRDRIQDLGPRDLVAAVRAAGASDDDDEFIPAAS